MSKVLPFPYAYYPDAPSAPSTCPLNSICKDRQIIICFGSSITVAEMVAPPVSLPFHMSEK